MVRKKVTLMVSVNEASLTTFFMSFIMVLFRENWQKRLVPLLDIWIHNENLTCVPGPPRTLAR